mgnify:CR=1 FL=1
MAMPSVSKRRQVINYLTNSDNGLTASEAKSRYGIKRLATVMHYIKNQLESNGNWEVVTETTARGNTRYFINDIHPNRTYGFNRMGKRVLATA